MKNLTLCRLLIAGFIIFTTVPAWAQTNPFTNFIISAPAAGTVSSSDSMAIIQGGATKNINPAALVQGGLAALSTTAAVKIGNELSTRGWAAPRLLVTSNDGTRAGIIGEAFNGLAPNTNTFPPGVIGYGELKIGSQGSTVFGLYGDATLRASAGIAIGDESDVQNSSGSAPDGSLPPTAVIGTTNAVPIGHVIACMSVGDHDCSLGLWISGDAGSSGFHFLTGEYINQFRNFGLVIEGDTTGVTNQTALITKDNGNALSQLWQITGPFSATKAVAQLIDAASAAHWTLFQNGDMITTGTLVMASMPTSCTSKPTGTLWKNGTVVNVCP